MQLGGQTASIRNLSKAAVASASIFSIDHPTRMRLGIDNLNWTLSIERSDHTVTDARKSHKSNRADIIFISYCSAIFFLTSRVGHVRKMSSLESIEPIYFKAIISRRVCSRHFVRKGSSFLKKKSSTFK